MWTQKEASSKYIEKVIQIQRMVVISEMCFVLQVVLVNTVDKAVKLNDGTLQRYDQLLISTGCRLNSSSNFKEEINILTIF